MKKKNDNTGASGMAGAVTLPGSFVEWCSRTGKREVPVAA